MLFGIVTGIIAAFGQSASYIFSRNFVVRFGSPILLMIYSQVIMGIFAALLLPWVISRSMFEETAVITPLLLTSLFYLLGQGSFFVAIREIEASRLSSLLGIKLLVLALINIVFLGQGINSWQWVAIFMCVTAATMMNWSGGKISWRMMMWVMLCCLFYSLSDIYARALVLSLKGNSLILRSLTATSMCYILLGAIAVPVLLAVKRSRGAFRAALPFAVCWFTAMLFLFACFAAVGTVFGNIVQSSRGLISVILGMMLVRMEMAHLESRTSSKALLRRIAAAMLMMAAIAAYTLASKK